MAYQRFITYHEFNNPESKIELKVIAYNDDEFTSLGKTIYTRNDVDIDISSINKVFGIRIYKQPISSSERDILMGKGHVSRNCISFIPCLEGSGNTIKDINSPKEYEYGNLEIIQTNHDYWNETSTLTWVKESLVAGVTKTLYIGLENPYAQNGNNIFLFFDDFSNGLDTEKWGTPTGTSPLLEVVDGKLHVYTGTYRGSCTVYSIPTFTIDNTIVKSMIRSSTNSYYRVQNLRLYADASNYAVRSIQSNHVYNNGDRFSNVVGGVSQSASDGYYMASEAFQEYRITNIDSGAKGLITGTTGGDIEFTLTNHQTGNSSVGFSIGDDYGNSGIYVDYIYVRKYVAVEPDVNITPISSNLIKVEITSSEDLNDCQIGINTTALGLSSNTDLLRVYDEIINDAKYTVTTNELPFDGEWDEGMDSEIFEKTQSFRTNVLAKLL